MNNCDIDNNIMVTKKIKLNHLIFDDDNDDKEYIIIDKKINTLLDLIELGYSYNPTKSYNIDLKLLYNMIPTLHKLNNMVGLDNVKVEIIDHIMFYLQKLDNSNIDMLHTVIEGPPGIGKTKLAIILGELYLAMGILKNNIFKKVSRTDMIAKFTGQTSGKTEELIDSCIGGVMFIDEVYSLGNKAQHDTYAKEAIDTLTYKLTQLKNNFICIVAGYSREINECFFSYNVGLQSRFPVRFSINPYTPSELFKIFKTIIEDNGWKLETTIKINFFKKNYDDFAFYGRDMENLFTKCKRTHSKRIFGTPNSIKKLITKDDLNKGFIDFLINKSNIPN
jgi:hypothetical protein